MVRPVLAADARADERRRRPWGPGALPSGLPSGEAGPRAGPMAREPARLVPGPGLLGEPGLPQQLRPHRLATDVRARTERSPGRAVQREDRRGAESPAGGEPVAGARRHAVAHQRRVTSVSS